MYAGGLLQDKTVFVFRLIVNGFLIGLIATSYGSLKSEGSRPVLKYDFFVFLLFSVFGLNLVLVANTFLLLFLALEVYSLSAYLLLASRKNRPASLEISFKYFVYSSFSSALLLFSVSLIYYRLGTIHFDDLHEFANYYSQTAGAADWALVLNLLLVLTAVAFKAGLAPFHL